MSATDASTAGMAHVSRRPSRLSELCNYFWSDNVRRIQTGLGLIWLLDGGLQFQAVFYHRGFTQGLAGLGPGNPDWLASSLTWATNIAQHDLGLWNTLFALTQVLLGIGILYRPSVKPALAASFAWALIVWWFGEAFGMMFMASTPMGGEPMASALIGAPGAVLLYGLIGAIVWPNGRPGGLFGARGARIVWVTLWLSMAYLWLVEGAGADGVSNMINAAPSGMSWLSSVQDWFATAAKGEGVPIALILGFVTAGLAVAPVLGWKPRLALKLAIALNLLYWVVGQGFGGLIAGGATDPNAGPLFMLLALAMLPLVQDRVRLPLVSRAVSPVPRAPLTA